ncbi:hypothetical protein [Polyangium sp. y55x31]|uniref:hypothetical protein n=1 Tax=Polyangium sp. y55x31 TaxID=3042688 RepID=UPI0024824E61|nr:hypothetical protein [Polyangium sp. y55x31]MDI1477589.1 hypothetical protein [Polyangium sp. y55x31]
MRSTATRLTASLGLAFGLGFGFTPLGCGSSPMGNPRPSAHGSHDGPSVPPATVAQLGECAEHGAARLTDTHYAIMFDVDVKADGQVDEAKVRESMIGDREIESCMTRVLTGMSLPGVVTPLRSSGPVYGGSVSPEGRAPMGHPAAAAAAAAVNLSPILIIAGGVTIVVAVTVHVAEEVVSEMSRPKDEPPPTQQDCKQVKDDCIVTCSRSSLPTGDHGFKFWNCVNKCMKAAGC